VTIDLSDCTDGELAALALAGRQPDYGELVRRHGTWVYRLARAHIGDADEALDIAQASFIAALASLAHYDPDRPFQAWLTRIAINKCRDWRRRRAVRKFFAFASPISDAAQFADTAPSAEQVVGGSEELRHAMTMIASLPSSLKEPLILRTIEEKSEAETAEILGISQKAVEMRLYRARARLAELMGKV